MIPACRYCQGRGDLIDDDGLAAGPCPRCAGAQLDEAWTFTITSDRPGFAKVRIAYGAHAAARPLADAELSAEAVELLLAVLGPGNRRGLVIREGRS